MTEKYQPDQRLPAAAVNDMLRRIETMERRLADLADQPQSDAAHGLAPPPCVRVDVLNSSGSTMDARSIQGIKRHAFTDTVDTERVVLEVEEPDAAQHEGRWVVLEEEIPDQGVGSAILSGLAVVKVAVGDADDTHAEMTDADPNKLTSASAGTARILWKESGTGDLWALVQFPVLPAFGEYDTPVDETYSAEHPETISTSNEYTTTDDGVDVLWDRAEPPAGGEKGIEITLSAGIAYYHDGDKKIYDYLLNLEIDDHGMIRRITAKRRQEIDDVEEC
jgi:hypothetical protein